MKHDKAIRQIKKLAARLVRKGVGTYHVAYGLIHEGVEMLRDEVGISSNQFTVTFPKEGNPNLTWPQKGHKCVVVPDEMLSATRISEYLDYATVYGAYDENTPNGTTAENGGPMNDIGRAAIVLLKKVLGQLPEDYTFSMPDGYGGMVATLHAARDQFAFYAEQHDAKGTEESAKKAEVNREFAARCHAATIHYDDQDAPTLHKVAAVMGREPRAGERIIITVDQDGKGWTTEYQGVQEAPGMPQEADSGVPASPLAPVLRDPSSAPLDRAEMLAILDAKLVGCQKHDMPEAFGVLTALRGEIAQHLEAAPLDVETALRFFYADVFDRNVKAGWWSDLATGTPKKRSVGELFILFVTELVEAYDAYCAGTPDDKLPQYPGLGVELGDLQIRLADFCGALAAGRIVEHRPSVHNPGDAMFCEIAIIARRYEAIRKTPEAIGQVEEGEPIEPQDVAVMTMDKLAFNATRADHKPENRIKEGGKQT